MKAIFARSGCLSCPSSERWWALPWGQRHGTGRGCPCPCPPGLSVPVPRGCLSLSPGAVPVPRRQPGRAVGSAGEGRLFPGPARCSPGSGAARRSEDKRLFSARSLLQSGCASGCGRAFSVGNRTCPALKLCPRSRCVDRASVFLLHMEGTNPW